MSAVRAIDRGPVAGPRAERFVQDYANDGNIVQTFLGGGRYKADALVGRFLPRLGPLTAALFYRVRRAGPRT